MLKDNKDNKTYTISFYLFRMEEADDAVIHVVKGSFLSEP